MGSNSSVLSKVVDPLEHAKPPKQTTLSPTQATPSAIEPSNLTALRNVSVESTSPSSEQATASDKETTPGESLQPANPVRRSQVMEDGDWLNREVERLAKKELDLEERENHLREMRLEINKEKQRLSAKEQDITLRKPKLKLKFELKEKEFDSEKERLQKRYEWLVAEGIRQQRGESWLDAKLSQPYWGSNTQHCLPCPTSPLQKSEWERKRKLQTEKKTKDQKYRLELQIKREIKELKREDERLRKKERQIESEEAEVNREVERLVERNENVVMEEIWLRDGEKAISYSFKELKRVEKYLKEKEKEIRKTTSQQSGGSSFRLSFMNTDHI